MFRVVVGHSDDPHSQSAIAHYPGIRQFMQCRMQRGTSQPGVYEHSCKCN
ncbi:hypothetical protein NIES4075_23180 [Tolypothrix sp. NIES-4075]|nr:hypothetical protein [Tolypothrix sp. NIES-4075]GAX41348.1 hypothetical protein NIES4075_23180 [Tolypothrix sp. NIES-4075]